MTDGDLRIALFLIRKGRVFDAWMEEVSLRIATWATYKALAIATWAYEVLER